MTSSIYGLYDVDGNLRYIGKADDPAKRIKTHMRDCGKRNTPIACWLRKNGIPTMRVLEAHCADWVESERRLIAEARQRGDKLLNVADGGNQPFCSAEVRAANGRKNALLHKDPKRRKMWEFKRLMGQGLKDGVVSNRARSQLRLLAMIDPKTYGAWNSIPDRVEA